MKTAAKARSSRATSIGSHPATTHGSSATSLLSSSSSKAPPITPSPAEVGHSPLEALRSEIDGAPSNIRRDLARRRDEPALRGIARRELPAGGLNFLLSAGFVGGRQSRPISAFG